MANEKQEQKKSVREEFAEKFISILESDKPMQWVQGWANSGFSRPYNGGSNRAYNGLNRFILSFEAMERGWTDPRFFTFKQASDEGYSVKKGEKSTRVEYWAVWDDVEKKSISISDFNYLCTMIFWIRLSAISIPVEPTLPRFSMVFSISLSMIPSVSHA